MKILSGRYSMNNKLAFTLILIVILRAGLEAFPITNAHSSSMEELAYLEITTYMTSLTKFNETYHMTVIGVVQNNLTTNAKSVRVNATFYDAQNNTIGKSDTPTELEIFKPGQKAPFTLYFSSTEVPARLELIAPCVKTNQEPIAGLQILTETLNAYTDESGYHRINGEIRNNAGGKAVMVKVICVYYDENANIIGTSRTFTNPNDILSGANASFELDSKPYKIEPAHYELLAIAHHYVLVPFVNYILFAILMITFISFIIYMKRKRGW
ncbi:MAG: FxLYD domain-containing protein [Candidatus Bathyarchaeota archaeon]|nr:FxLYD domain-containing protein [Candidatus Bathyarchaeota archaeon]